MESFIPTNKFEKLVHLVSFITRIIEYFLFRVLIKITVLHSYLQNTACFIAEY